jgi:phosphoglycolate phosphatase
VAYKLVIFDFDGTLADSADWVRRTINQVADRYRFKRIAGDEFATLRGRDNRAIIRHLGVPAWKMPLIANHMRALMSRDADQIRLFEGAGDLLRRLQGGGITLAIVSSNSEENVRRILGPENAALISIYACGASIFGKAAKFRRVLRRSQLSRGEILCIGDETRDIEAAAAQGLASGAVTWGYATADVLRAHGPTLVFDHMDDIAALLTAEPVG